MTLYRSLIVILMALLISMPAGMRAVAQSNDALVSVVHASPDAPAVDVYIDGTLTLTNVPFFTASPYLPLPAGEHRFQITPTGASTEAAVIDAVATVEGGKAYTVAAIGPVAEIRGTIVDEDLSMPAEGQARVDIYHLSPDAPAVDVKLADGTLLASNIAYPSVTGLELPAGTYDLVVTPAGSDDVVLSLPGTTLTAGRIYDFFAVGFVSDLRIEVVETDPVFAPAPPTPPEPPVLPGPTSSFVRVIHASPDAPAVDIYVNGNLTWSAVPFFTVTDYIEVPAGEYRFQVTPAGQPPEAAVIDGVATLEAGQAYSVAAINPVAEVTARIILENLTPPPPGRARVNVYHLSPDAPAVDVKLTNGTVLAAGLAYPGKVELEADAGTYDIIVTPAGSDTVVIDLSGTTLEAGYGYDIFAVDFVANLQVGVVARDLIGGIVPPEPTEPVTD
ncbi:MAG: DUF4397 domain-containing protein [Chloroflexaceae bacterium]|nr:DUF4397 domain-containing protein [Chloroflexaceae bacterium]